MPQRNACNQPPHSCSVEELLDRANSADMAAVGELLERFDGYIQAQLRRQRSDEGQPPGSDLIEELTQEVRVRVWGRVSAHKPLSGGESGFRAFLRDTAWHLWLDHVSATRREVSYSTVFDSERDLAEGEHALNPLEGEPDPGSDPLAELVNLESDAEFGRTVWSLLEDLDREHPGRRYLDLYELQIASWKAEAAGMPRSSSSEMARRLGTSQASVSKRLSQIWTFLRQRWPASATRLGATFKNQEA